MITRWSAALRLKQAAVNLRLWRLRIGLLRIADVDVEDRIATLTLHALHLWPKRIHHIAKQAHIGAPAVANRLLNSLSRHAVEAHALTIVVHDFNHSFLCAFALCGVVVEICGLSV